MEYELTGRSSGRSAYCGTETGGEHSLRYLESMRKLIEGRAYQKTLLSGLKRTAPENDAPAEPGRTGIEKHPAFDQ